MSGRAPLPLFENSDDARVYVVAFAAIIGGLAVMVAAAVAFVLTDAAAASIGVAVGLLALIVGQVLYLMLSYRVWVRHRPDDPWDWNSARAFHEGSFVATYKRAWRLSRSA